MEHEAFERNGPVRRQAASPIDLDFDDPDPRVSPAPLNRPTPCHSFRFVLSPGEEGRVGGANRFHLLLRQLRRKTLPVSGSKRLEADFEKTDHAEQPDRQDRHCDENLKEREAALVLFNATHFHSTFEF